MNAEVSGKAFLGLLKYVRDKEGPEVLAEIVTKSGSQTEAVFARRIRISSWHPYLAFSRFIEELERKLGQVDGSFCRLLGATTGDRDLGSIFSIYKDMASPERLIRACPRVWKSYYRNAGRMVAVTWEPENTTLRIYDFPEMHPYHCRLMEGWMSNNMTKIGCPIGNDSMETHCTSKGDPYHEFFFTWSRESAELA